MASVKDIGASLHRAFGQPADQGMPADLIRLLSDIDRANQPLSSSPLTGKARSDTGRT